MNKTKIIAIIMIIIILIVITILIILNTLKKQMNLGEEVEETETIEESNLNELTSPLIYYNVNETIKKYMLYEQINNEMAIKSILSSTSNDLVKENIKEENYYYIKKAYAMDKISNVIFYLQVIINGNDQYFVVNIDYSDYAFKIYGSDKKEFYNAVSGNVSEKYNKSLYVEKNEYNQITKNVSNMSIIQMYYDDYKNEMYYNIEESFNRIDKEYKLAKFNNDIEYYKDYMKNNLDKILESEIIEYWLQEENNNSVYIFRDTNNEYVTIKVSENSDDYFIMLDNYTIETEEYKEKYNKATSKEKVETNLSKIFKLINEKEYKKIYNYLDQTFKDTYFKTNEEFEKFITDNFFDKNIIQTVKEEKQGNNYILTVNYASNDSIAAENNMIIIIMQLKEGTDFVMSFNVQ